MFTALKRIPLWSRYSGVNPCIFQSSLASHYPPPFPPNASETEWKVTKSFCSSQQKSDAVTNNTVLNSHKQPLKKSSPAGISDFGRLRRAEYNYAFVDKTMFIYEFLCTNPGSTELVLRPRRFGKSLNVSMLEYYLSVLHKDSYNELFEGTMIDKETQLKKKHANQYPVIKIDFANFCPSSCDSPQQLIKYFHGLLLKVIDQYQDLLNRTDKLGQANLVALDALMRGEQAQVLSGLGELSRFLQKIYGQECIILLDEYDNPIQKVLDSEEKMAVLLDHYPSFLISGLKGNTSLAKALVTGCTKVAQQQIFSGLNNLLVNSLLTKDSFQEHYGFSEMEVREFLKETADSTTQTVDEIEVKKYYNGYKVPVTQNGKVILMDVYNPFSISHYANKRALEPYWVETAEHRMMLQSSYEKDPETTAEMFKVKDGAMTEKPLDNSISLLQVKNLPEKIWTLLFHAGYLTLGDYPRIRTNEDGNGVYKLQTPNVEIKTAFTKLLERFSILQREEFKTPLNEAFRENNLMLFQQTINSMINLSDTSGHSFRSEDRYDRSIYWALWFHIRDHWDVYSQIVLNNRNRFDIIIVPKDKCKTRIGYIIEVKHLDAKYAQKLKAIQSELHEALEQIKDRKYYTHFLTNGSLNVEKFVYIGIVGCNSRISLKSEEVDAQSLVQGE